MSAMKKMIGDTVLNDKHEPVDVDTFSGKGKYVGLYFSAHWCPPCQGFTPVLAEFYKNLKLKEQGESFEIVFISSDRDEESWKGYFADMPWKSLAFSEREKKAELAKQFSVTGIPCLIILNAETGEVVTTDGRGKVTTEPEKYPWI